GEGARPRAIVSDESGNAWVLDSGLNAILRIGGERLGSERFPLPAKAAPAGLESAVFDDDGRLWFTGSRGFHGRLDPARRLVEVWPSPQGKAANGIICPTGPVTAAEQLAAGNPIREVALAFRAAFAKANGEAPTDSFSSYSFDGWLVFVDAAKRALATGAKPGSPEFRSALREALFTTKDVVGTQGVYTFTPADRHGVDARARIMVQIEDGHYKLLP
ncbi:MAG: ABC transporter substrate-binding protein, partial [Bradyrhizobium sp.]